MGSASDTLTAWQGSRLLSPVAIESVAFEFEGSSGGDRAYICAQNMARECVMLRHMTSVEDSAELVLPFLFDRRILKRARKRRGASATSRVKSRAKQRVMHPTSIT